MSLTSLVSSGPLLLAKHFAARLAPDGSFLFMSGATALKPAPGMLAVGATNAAVDAITAALRRAAKRGEIRPGVITGLLAQTGPALVIHQQMHYGSPPSEAEITEIVDCVLFPALSGPATAAR